LVAVVFVALATTLAAERDTPGRGGVLKVAVWFDITHMNPFLDTRSVDNIVRSLMYEGLTDWDKAMDVVPALASSWKISKDGKEYVFSLRKGVTFHGGQELKADDVKWSMEYIMNPKNGAYTFSSLVVIDSVQSLDPYTIKFVLKQPHAGFLSAVASNRTPILPGGSVTTRRPPSFPPGTGPFEFVEWKSGDHITIKKNRDYWQKGIPYLDGVLFRPVPDEVVRLSALRNGDVDFVERLPYQNMEALKAGEMPGLSFSVGEAAGAYRIRFNLRRAPFQDARMRQAVAWAINKDEVVKAATWNQGKAINWRYPKGTKWFVDLQDRTQDVKTSKGLIEEAGFGRGAKASVPLHVASLPAGQVLKAQLEKVGILLNLETMDRGAYRRRIEERSFDIVISGYPMYGDADEILYDYFHSSLADQLGSSNESGYKNPETDRLLEEGRKTLDFAQRKKIYAEVGKILLRDVPEIPLYTHPFIFGFRSYVKGFEAEAGTGTLSYAAARAGIPVTWMDR
jgi:ABC-type transport system substrate-binding protein